MQYYYDNYVNPIRAASLRHINDIIRPSETRPVLIKSLELIKSKKKVIPEKKHGNIPL
jgi:acetyl-CoA carboxylase carboxyltransferase component